MVFYLTTKTTTLYPPKNARYTVCDQILEYRPNRQWVNIEFLPEKVFKEKKCSESIARRGLRLSVFFQSSVYELTMSSGFCYLV